MPPVNIKNLDDLNIYTRERYFIAASYCINKNVIDIASNTGYGTYILSKIADNVIGYDNDINCIKLALNNWKKDNITFLKGDLLYLEPKKFDVVVSLETVEHLNIPIKDTIKKLINFMHDKSLLIISIPEDEQHEPNETHYHTKIKKDFMIRIINELNLNIINIIKQYTINDSGYNQLMFILEKKEG